MIQSVERYWIMNSNSQIEQISLSPSHTHTHTHTHTNTHTQNIRHEDADAESRRRAPGRSREPVNTALSSWRMTWISRGVVGGLPGSDTLNSPDSHTTSLFELRQAGTRLTCSTTPLSKCTSSNHYTKVGSLSAAIAFSPLLYSRLIVIMRLRVVIQP